MRASIPVELALQERSVDLPALSFRAGISLASLNEDARTVDVVWTTGAGVRRYDWDRGEYYLEKLSLDPEHVRLERLNTGAPVLNSHRGYGIESILGVVEDGTASLSGKRGLATLRFSRRADVEPYWGDVKDKTLRNVSVGYAVYAYEETRPKKAGGLPVRTAVDWEPYEISMVPMPADAGAQTRAGKPANGVELHRCVIRSVAGSPEPDEQEQTRMDPETTRSETIAERDPLDPGAPTGQAPATRADAPEPTDKDLGADAERERITGITKACRAARMPSEFMDKLIEGKTPLVRAQAMVFEEMRKRADDGAGPAHTPAARGGHDIRLGADPLVHVRAGIENALLHRLAPSHFKLEEVGRNYRGMTMLDVGRVFLQGLGHRVTNLPKMELAGFALGLSGRGMHTTSDFANLLADVANKTLRRAYDEAPQTFRPIVTIGSLPDFKPVNRVQLGDAPAFLKVDEHGEFRTGTIGEGKESYQLATYGRKFAITRQALINDDTDAFSRIPMMFGRKARVLESNLVWEQITSNPTMGDNNALFSAAHGNLQTDGDAISVASLGRARAALRQQVSVDGDYLNLSAAYLIVPTVLETKADQYVSVVTPQEAGKVNPFQQKLIVIAEPRLDANSATAWYLAAPTSQVDIVELAYLDGEQGPQVESRVGFDVDGVEIKARIDVAAKVLDWRGLHKDPGDLDS